MHIASQLKLPFSTKKEKLFFTLPIRQRLTLGFLLAALIAGLLAGGTALTRIQSLHQQSDFLLSTAPPNKNHARIWQRSP